MTALSAAAPCHIAGTDRFSTVTSSAVHAATDAHPSITAAWLPTCPGLASPWSISCRSSCEYSFQFVPFGIVGDSWNPCQTSVNAPDTRPAAPLA
jgi:hypothetical protein